MFQRFDYFEMLYVLDNDTANLDLLHAFKLSIVGKLAIDVLTFHKGRDVIDYLSKTEQLPDLLILDLILPDIEGDDLIQILDAQDKTKNLPMILMSGIVINVDNRANAVGADTYLKKPFSIDALVKKIREFIDV
ncbi:response regulator [Flavilitoribacter nigricans]|uniref:Response regulatory domain-containing protein n=1 Tax=Flavilitoribacter nigricans (strain ATCC 23147 / DSM 23189 / NBRC 102662 / NCIMB 1420 / SS-2) TaxID=1122177 RepID=A0A2D0NI74_FLAN2|nr:response regulator [Flavilitoribacter nigricans]PHN08128.1 hypothetical protein CRP01_02060 [Flavilitoribacter nigricans DSM 23189 = NBRC 102662]